MDRNDAARSWTRIGRGLGWAGQSSHSQSQAPSPIRIMNAAGEVLRTLDPKDAPPCGGFHEESDARARKRAQQARRGGRRAHPRPARDTAPVAGVLLAEPNEPAWPEAEDVLAEPVAEERSEDRAG